MPWASLEKRREYDRWRNALPEVRARQAKWRRDWRGRRATADRICTECGRWFTPFPRWKVCGQECLERRRRRYAFEHRNANPRYYHDKRREYREREFTALAACLELGICIPQMNKGRDYRPPRDMAYRVCKSLGIRLTQEDING